MTRFYKLTLLFFCFGLGFILKSLLETEEIINFLTANFDLIIISIFSFLILIGAFIIALYYLIKKIIRREIDLPKNDEATVKQIVEVITNQKKIDEIELNDRLISTISFGALWFIRISASQFYLHLVVTLVGGLIGIATLFLLSEQNKIINKQNARPALQTDANITESILLEGTRRASLSQDLFGLITEVRSVIQVMDEDSERCFCGTRSVGNCWRWKGSKKIAKSYILSKGLMDRLSAFAARNPP